MAPVISCTADVRQSKDHERKMAQCRKDMAEYERQKQ